MTLSQMYSRRVRGIRTYDDLTGAQQRAMSVLYLVAGAAWRGDRADAALGKRTCSDHPWSMTVHSRTARALETLGFAEIFISRDHHDLRCRITPTGQGLIERGKATNRKKSTT